MVVEEYGTREWLLLLVSNFQFDLIRVRRREYAVV